MHRVCFIIGQNVRSPGRPSRSTCQTTKRPESRATWRTTLGANPKANSRQPPQCPGYLPRTGFAVRSAATPSAAVGARQFESIIRYWRALTISRENPETELSLKRPNDVSRGKATFRLRYKWTAVVFKWSIKNIDIFRKNLRSTWWIHRGTFGKQNEMLLIEIGRKLSNISWKNSTKTYHHGYLHSSM